ncbi:hypothetical protein ACIBEJ_00165 [Nonomuraea sp. NPDC050790]|uniref:hypothetical protein n=1 Tax=Nonomuraea sp. NPDC050790 TaxID=3364371 RepID=UPI0037B04699
MADHERREDELLVPAPRDDETKNETRDDEIRNEEIRNDEARNDEIRNDELRNDEARNDELRNDEARDDYATSAVYDTQPDAAHTAHTREPYAMPADDSVPPAPPYPEAVETARGSGQDVGDGAYMSGDQMADRWRDVQAGFVDDPRAAVERADDLLEELLQEVTRKTGEMRESWKSQQDTEQLRLALRDYRSVMERLMAFAERK